MNIITPSCRFCYNYKPPGLTEICCPSIVTASCTLSTMASIPSIVNNSTQTTQRSLLLASQHQVHREVHTAQIGSTIQSTIDNTDAITTQLQTQLEELTFQRYEPYRPYIYPVMPSSVMELAMKTANVGNPMPPFTIMDCKGSQFVTK